MNSAGKVRQFPERQVDMTPRSAILERESAALISDPTAAQIARELKKLRTTGPSSYATLTLADGTYLQTAGSPGGLLLERHDASGRHLRGFQQPPVVPFEDGTELIFAAGRIKLNAGEWFRLAQVVELFTAFLQGVDVPAYVQWRDITSMLGLPSPKSR